MDWIWLAAAALVLFFAWNRRRGLAKAEAVGELMAAGAAIVDVRTPGEFQRDHVDGAVNMPLDTIGTAAAKTLRDKQRPILLYCLSGTRSGAARRQLTQLGYSRVHNLGSLSRARKVLRAAG
jgi:phage shock protein E